MSVSAKQHFWHVVSIIKHKNRFLLQYGAGSCATKLCLISLNNTHGHCIIVVYCKLCRVKNNGVLFSKILIGKILCVAANPLVAEVDFRQILF